MSDPVFTGQDVADAVAAAARSLGLEASRLRYVVLDPGRPGALGVGPSPARIAVLLERRPAGDGRAGPGGGTVPAGGRRPGAAGAAHPGTCGRTSAALVRVLARGGRGVDLSAEVGAGPDGLRVRMQGAGCAMLLEEEGEVFRAFEHVLQRAYRGRLTSGRLTVECEGYRDHRDERPARGGGPGAGQGGGGGRAGRGAPSRSTPTSDASSTWS